MNKKIYGVPFLVVVVLLAVYSAGCVGSAMVHTDPLPDGTPGTGEKDLPPLLNYPLSMPVQVDDGVPGIYVPGDILQPSKDSPLYEPDLAVVIIRDSSDGRYEISGVVRSEGTWFRIPGSVPGLVDHLYIEQIFTVRPGHEDYNSMKILDMWQPDVSTGE